MNGKHRKSNNGQCDQPEEMFDRHLGQHRYEFRDFVHFVSPIFRSQKTTSPSSLILEGVSGQFRSVLY
ncbi:hypothetical protein MPLA_320032 [Mesorhizobium sp. ORS 3359]|nr:hypothetical protein MPLA_320032 [Mesorhizobium sp. ORS 3359]